MTQMAELALLTPQVMAARLTGLAVAGWNPNPSQRAEGVRMWTEKQAAFTQSWQAMAAQAWVAHGVLAASALRAMGWPATGTTSARLQDARTAVQREASTLLASGIAPVHRTVVANARRLKRASGR